MGSTRADTDLKVGIDKQVDSWIPWNAAVVGGLRTVILGSVITVVCSAAALALTWGVSYSRNPGDPSCNGHRMRPGDVCEFRRHGSQYGTLEYTRSYDEMAHQPVRWIAWTITVLVLLAAVFVIAALVTQHAGARRPTVDEATAFVQRYTEERSRLSALLAEQPDQWVPRRSIEFLDKAFEAHAKANGIRVEGGGVSVDPG